MRRKASYAQLAEQCAYHDKQHSLYMIALQYVMRHESLLVATYKTAEGDTYDYSACGESRADGGLVLMTFIHPGQAPDTRVSYIEDEYTYARTHAYGTPDATLHYEAMSKVLAHRNKQQGARGVI